MAALITISKKLDHLDKSKAKAKGAKPLAATTRTTPRESVAKASDNRSDALNFGRDTFPGFEAQKAQMAKGAGRVISYPPCPTIPPALIPSSPGRPPA